MDLGLDVGGGTAGASKGIKSGRQQEDHTDIHQVFLPVFDKRLVTIFSFLFNLSFDAYP